MRTCILIMAALCAVNASAAVDDEGMPVFYIRGSQTGSQWNVNEAYRFSRQGNSYSIHLDALDGGFKIADDSWTPEYDFGAPVPKPGTYTVSRSETINSLRAGGNIIADHLTDVTISFDFVRGAQTLPVSITVGGQPAGTPGISGTLPVLYINVYTDNTHSALDNEIISKDLDHKNYFSSAEYWLDLNGCSWMEADGAESIGSENKPLPLEIKARGNWTRRGFAKKPFKLKLGKKQPMLGMTKSKHFALLAHADDTWGYLRNFIGFNLGQRIGLPWTPHQQPVEVVINGDYRGLYFLTESVRVGDDRIMISELDDDVSDTALASGGYLVELDNYDEENQIRLSEKVASGANPTCIDLLRITCDTPESYSDLQRRFVTDQFTAMNDAVGAVSDDLWSYMDLDDAARYYIVEEIISHTESYHGSTYMFRDRGEGQKWHFSPLWDCGNAFSGPTDDYFYRHAPFGTTWLPSMRLNDRFMAKVTDTWLWFMQQKFPGLITDIDTYVSAIAEAAKADSRRWKGQPKPDGGVDVTDNSDMEACRERAVAHLQAKIAWLGRQWGDYTTGHHAEPARDDTPAAPLPTYMASINDVEADDTNSSLTATYYDLTGRPAANLIPGHIYIRRQESRATLHIAR